MLLPHNDRKPVFGIITYGSLMIVASSISKYSPAENLSAIAYMLCILFAGVMLGYVAEWIVGWWYKVTFVKSQSEKVELARSIASMTDEQLIAFMWLCGESVEQQQPETPDGFMPVPADPPIKQIRGLDIDGTHIPYQWVSGFFRKSNGKNLPPIRSYPSGSIDRRYAETLTNWLIEEGLAEPATSNKSAALLSWKATMDALPWRETLK